MKFYYEKTLGWNGSCKQPMADEYLEKGRGVKGKTKT
jgi:hypothetical protein